MRRAALRQSGCLPRSGSPPNSSSSSTMTGCSETLGGDDRWQSGGRYLTRPRLRKVLLPDVSIRKLLAQLSNFRKIVIYDIRVVRM